MFDTYADTVTIDVDSPADYVTRVAVLLQSTPEHPIRIQGEPGTGKLSLLTRIIATAGLQSVLFNVALCGDDLSYLEYHVEESDGPVVLIIDEAQHLQHRSEEFLASLARLVEDHPAVVATFVVETTPVLV